MTSRSVLGNDVRSIPFGFVEDSRQTANLAILIRADDVDGGQHVAHAPGLVRAEAGDDDADGMVRVLFLNSLRQALQGGPKTTDGFRVARAQFQFIAEAPEEQRRVIAKLADALANAAFGAAEEVRIPVIAVALFWEPQAQHNGQAVRLGPVQRLDAGTPGSDGVTAQGREFREFFAPASDAADEVGLAVAKEFESSAGSF